MQQDFRKRLAGIGLLLPLAVAVYLGGVFAFLAILVICLFLIFELAKLLGHSLMQRVSLSAYFILPAIILLVTSSAFNSGIVLMLGMFLLIRLQGVVAGLYAAGLALCLCSFAYLLYVPDFNTQLLALGAVIAAVDSGAYIVGRRIGGKKLAAKISPKKTVSGAVGGLVFGVAVGLMLAPLFALTPMMAILIAATISVIAQVGDLFESALKRQVNVKDSSSFIPGHGGFLDRFDGYIFVIPLLVILNSMIGVGT